MHEIGGDFEIDRTVEDFEGCTGASLDSIFNSNLLWYSAGRMALRAILRSLPHGVFLVPSYLCESILQAFEQESVSNEFYPVRDGLRVCAEDIAARLSRRTIGIFFIDYFGMDMPGDVRHLLEQSLMSGLYVIEDITHGFPGVIELTSRPASHVLCSVRKTLPVPDGAFVLAKKGELAEPSLEAGDYVEAKLRAQVRKSHYLRGMGSRDFLPMMRMGESGFDLDSEVRGLSRWTRAILPGIDFARVAQRRRANYLYLFERFVRCGSSVVPLLGGLPAEGSPLGFPILSSRRDELRAYLVKRGIYPPVHWDLPDIADGWAAAHNPIAREISSQELTIPCDQRYDEEDMDYVVDQIMGFEACNSGP